MTRLIRATARAIALNLLVVPAVLGTATVHAEPVRDGRSELVVELDKEAIDAGPGERFTFQSTVRNTGDAPSSDLVAHLNILTTDPDVYVDPEDWSAQRTQYLDELPAGQATRLSWNVQAVTSGPLILYVAVTDPAADSVIASGPLQLTVAGQRVVDSGGALPLVTLMPAIVLALLGAALARRRRHY